jgi:hypothetical protein
MSAVSPLREWFSIMDSDQPERILELISADFRMSVVFSTGAEGTDFSGDREALVAYLAQRLRDVRRHRVLSSARTGPDELVLGEVQRDGVFEASFVAAARLTEDGLVRRLLIGRSPGTRFTEHGTD